MFIAAAHTARFVLCITTAVSAAAYDNCRGLSWPNEPEYLHSPPCWKSLAFELNIHAISEKTQSRVGPLEVMSIFDLTAVVLDNMYNWGKYWHNLKRV